MCWVYILQSHKNGRYYIGSTSDLNRRIIEHHSGKSKYTSEVLPVELVFSQEYSSLNLARKTEQWIKKSKSKLLINKIIEEGIIRKSIC